MLNTNKFYSKAKKCIMLEYSECSKGYTIYNIKTNIIGESIYVKFNDKLDSESQSQLKNL